MTDMEQRAAAKEFAADWKGRGDEKQETQAFWLSLLQKVYGVAEPEKYIEFEVPVKLDHTSFIDGLIKTTRVLIEQKGKDIDLNRGYKQSDGSMLTPFQQARRYAGYLPHDLNPRWIIVCNFQEFHIHDMNRPNDAPEVLLLSKLEKEYNRLNFLVDTGDANIKREMEISMQAGELVGRLYDAFLKQYKNPDIMIGLKVSNMQKYTDFIEGRDYTPLLDVKDVFSLNFFSRLLAHNEAFDQRDAQKSIVKLESKLQDVYTAIWGTDYDNGTYSKSVGGFVFTSNIKEKLSRIVGLMSRYNNVNY